MHHVRPTARRHPASFVAAVTLIATLVLALVAALVVALGAAPFAHADTRHLESEQARARRSISHARASLEESIHQTRHAFQALTRSRAVL